MIQCSFFSKKIFFVAQKEQLFWIKSMSITTLCCAIIWNTPRLVVTYINNLWRNVKLFTNHFLNFNCTKMKWQEFIHNHPSLLEFPHSLIYLWHSSADTSVYWSVPLGRLEYRKLHNSDLWYKCREVPTTSPILDNLHFVFQRIHVTQVLFNWQIYLTIIIPGLTFRQSLWTVKWEQIFNLDPSRAWQVMLLDLLPEKYHGYPDLYKMTFEPWPSYHSKQ